MAAIQRLFVSVLPSAQVAEELLALLPADLPPSARAVPVAHVHLTLQFIGERHERELDDILLSVQRAASGVRSFNVTPTHLATLPQGASSRLIAVVTDCPPTLAELQRRLALRLASAKSRSRDTEFMPHLTLARFSPPAPIPAFSKGLSLSPIAFDRVVLQRSLLKPTGAEHQTVAMVALLD